MHKQNPGIEEKITLKEIKKLPDTKIYIITPTHIKYFNQQLFGDAESATLKLT